MPFATPDCIIFSAALLTRLLVVCVSISLPALQKLHLRVKPGKQLPASFNQIFLV